MTSKSNIRPKILVAIVAIGFAFFAFVNMSTPSLDQNLVSISVSDNACFSINSEADEFADITKLQRGALQSTLTKLNLLVEGSTESVFLGFTTARLTAKTADSDDSYFGGCTFSDGPAGFQTLVNTRGTCQSIQGTAYHSAPGSRETIIVTCPADGGNRCAMTLFERIGPMDVTLSVAMSDLKPQTWRSMAASVRSFIRNHVQFSAQC